MAALWLAWSSLSASERMRKDAKSWCISHPYRNLRLGRMVMVPQPGILHHTPQKKSLPWLQHQILVEIFDVSYQALFNLRRLPLLWKLSTWVVSENSGSFGSPGGEIVAVTVFKVKMFMCDCWPERAFLAFTRRRERGGWRWMDRGTRPPFARKLNIKFLFNRRKEKDILQPWHSWTGAALSLQHSLKLQMKLANVCVSRTYRPL